MKKLVLSCVVLLASSIVTTVQAAPQILVERGHSAGIEAMAFAPGGEILASASQDGSIRLWNAAGSWQSTLLNKEGAGEAITALAFSPDGAYLAAGGRTGKVYLWPVPSKSGVYRTGTRTLKFGTGKVLANYGGDNPVPIDARPGDEALASLAFSHDGKLLAAAGYYGHSQYSRAGVRLQVWNALDGASLWTKTSTGNQPGQIAFETTGNLVTTQAPNLLQRWTSTGQELEAVTIPEEPTRTGNKVLLALSPDGTHVLAKGQGDYKIYDAKTGQLLVELAANPREMPARTQRQREQAEQILGRPAPTRNRPAATAANRLGTPVGAQFSPDGKLVAVAFRQTETRVWDTSNGQEVTQALSRNHSSKGVLAFSSQDVLALDATEAGGGIWQKGELKAALPTASYPIQSLEIFSRNGAPILLVGTTEGALAQWNLATGKIEQITGNAGRELAAMAVSPDGRLLAVAEYLKSYTLSLQQRGAERGRLRVVELATGRDLWTRSDFGRSKISRLKFSRDGQRLWLAGQGGPGRPRAGVTQGEGFGALEVLNTNSGQPSTNTVQLSDDDGVGAAPQMDLSQTDSRLAIGGGNFLRVWDLPQGKLIFRAGNPGRNPNLLSLSPNGNRLAYIGQSRNNTVRIWDLTRERDITHRHTTDMADAQGRAALTGEEAPTLNVVTFAGGETGQLLAGDARGRLLVWGQDWQDKDTMTLPLMVLEDEAATAVTTLQVAPPQLFPDLVLSGHSDGTVRLWDIKNKKLLITLSIIPKPTAMAPRILNLQAPEGPAVTQDDFDWICWTPGGLYATSPGGDSLLRWREGETVIATPQNAAVQRREDIVPRVLEKLSGR